MKTKKAPRVANAHEKGRAVSVGSGALFCGLGIGARKWNPKDLAMRARTHRTKDVKTTIETSLSAAQLSRVRDLINDKQDAMFKTLHALVAAGHHDHAQGVREGLKFWDDVDRQFARVVNDAWDAQHASQAAPR
jgi:hypothetical protein